jgi:hypothetical protein
MCLAAAEKSLMADICRLSGNNRPITDYLKNGRLIGFADYLPINRLIPTCGSSSTTGLCSSFGSSTALESQGFFSISGPI